MKIIAKVIKGRGIGKTLGFPTLNFELENNDISGVFSGKVCLFHEGDIRECRLQNKEYKAAIFIGKPKTFNENKRTFETHLLDFNNEVKLGTSAEIFILEKIRDIKKFNSVEELKKAIASDCDKIRKMGK